MLYQGVIIKQSNIPFCAPMPIRKPWQLLPAGGGFGCASVCCPAAGAGWFEELVSSGMVLPLSVPSPALTRRAWRLAEQSRHKKSM